jgi:hypothetical protein
MAWLGVQILDYGAASRFCGARSAEPSAQLVRAIEPWFLWLTGAAFLIALAGCWVARRNWLRTRNEQSGSDLQELNEARTRFMAMCGLLTSVSFSVAFLFTGAYMVVAPLCAR